MKTADELFDGSDAHLIGGEMKKTAQYTKTCGICGHTSKTQEDWQGHRFINPATGRQYCRLVKIDTGNGKKRPSIA